jgi:hypothetical protein
VTTTTTKAEETPSRTRATRKVDPTSVAIVVFAALLPFTQFLATNATKLTRPGAVLTDMVGWLVLNLVLFAAIRAWWRKPTTITIAAMFAAANLSFWNFGRWLPYEPASATTRWVGIALWLLVTVVVVRLAMRLAAWKSAGTFLVILLGVMTLVPALTYATTAMTIGDGDAPLTYQGAAFAPFETRPDVYWFVLDEHASAPQVERWTGRAVSWFGRDLEERGFATSDSSHSGYLFTHLSIPSTLAMEYAFQPGGDYPTEYTMAVPFLAGDNPVVETFEANGYRYVFAPEGSTEWTGCPVLEGDRVCVPPVQPAFSVSGPHTKLLWSTPIGSLGFPVVHNDFDSVLDGVDEIRAEDPDRPLFTFAHILSPHYPYRYGEGCAPRSPWVEGTAFTGEERAAAYGNEVDCIDRSAIGAVDRILAEDPDAVIVIQGDHGSTLTFNWQLPFSEWSDASFAERLSPLNAIRLPEACSDRSIEGEPLVNTFRLVLACLSGTEPDLLPTRAFSSSYGTLADLTELDPDRYTPDEDGDG